MNIPTACMPPPPDPLATLRAEVERLRDGWLATDDHLGKGLRVQTLTEVLDLIDKQREGQ